MKKVHITSLGCAKNLVDSEMSEGKRYYWINKSGKKILSDIESLSL